MKAKNKINKAVIASMAFIVFSLIANAQDYQLDFSDPSTYTITCGKVTPGQWSVKNDTCLLYTPYIRAEVAEVDVNFSFNVNQSGNGDVYDKGYVYHSVDGGSWELDTLWNAGGHPAVYKLNTTVTLEYGHYVQFMVRLATNDKTEFWSIMDGGVQATDGNDSDHEIQVYETEPEGLPVSLISFSGIAENNSVILEWSTASETNNDFFVVEKSDDGVNFESVGYVDGSGNSNILISYEYVDENPYKITFYRLRQTDYDGAFSYSSIIKVSVDESPINEIGVTSNNGILNIMANNTEGGKLQINIYSMTGAEVYNSNVDIDKGSTTITVSPGISGNSIYIISASLNGQQPVHSKVYFN